MLKGAGSEARIGYAIEYALTRDDCAVAHNVMKIVNGGDIDHLVATPLGLWMIETKSKRHANTEDAKLKTIAAKVKDVRLWASPGTKVVGGLVYVEDTGAPHDSVRHIHGESIQVFRNRKSITDALHAEAHMGGGSQELADNV